MSTTVPVLREIDDLTATWLEAVLEAGPIAGFRAEPIGTGQMSESHRVTLDYGPGGPGAGGRRAASVVVKTAASDPNSRATGVGLGAYEREIRFYRELAPRVGGPLPDCHAAVLDPAEGWFTLVLEDVAPARAGRPDRGLRRRAGAPGDARAGACSMPPSSPTRSSARRRGSTRRCRSTRR